MHKHQLRPLRILGKLVVTFSLFAMLANASHATSQTSREYHLKAAFLRYVVKFVDWPKEATPETTMNICLLGKVPHFKGINSINGKIVNEKELVIRRVESVDKALENNACQLLYVQKSETNKMADIIEQTKGKPILTFGDMDDFAKTGGNMNFYIMNNRLAIMISPPQVEESGLTIHPRMLRLVTVVPPIDQRGFYFQEPTQSVG